MTVRAGDTAVISDMNEGDTFTVDGTAYMVGAVAPINEAGKLWTGSNYTNGIEVAALSVASNWTPMQSITGGIISVDTTTLDYSDKVAIVDDEYYPTQTFGTLSRDTAGIYTLLKGEVDDKYSGITLKGIITDVDVELADVKITTHNANGSESIFTVTPLPNIETFRVDATGDMPKVEGASEIELYKGPFAPGDGQIIHIHDGGKDIDRWLSCCHGHFPFVERGFFKW